MNRWMACAALTFAFAVPGRTCLAGEGDIRLKDGPRKELVLANCSICHSLDYIEMNSVFLDRAGWQKSVDKMIKVMGAPVRPEDVGPIVDYLTAAYGVDK